ncbi:hypothetical protein [Sphingomicrobium clamense]|uniref:Uncharacterized protein n=1 Tax=Sphingomicrobium clamense TaxID=2851013 RepID=A0ABS6V7W0_9SPHN|nr:hypothetical protein [Sphingomicrobium sp. B8]MBW0145571.1 hypothetical protein [Sphingomicrobium sp. B8]
MRSLSILALLTLIACENTVEDAGSVAYEGPSELTAAPDDPQRDAVVAAGAASGLDGRYGASAADCASDNRYMTEYLEIDGPTLSYRGQDSVIAIVREDSIVLRGGEELAREEDRLVRWPDQRRKRTVYTRCS